MAFTSTLEIGQLIKFKPMQRHCEKYAIACSDGYGKITAVRFTKAKVFYDIIDDYYGLLFDNVDSCNVESLNNN